MKKKIVVFCLFAVIILMVLPAAPTLAIPTKQQLSQDCEVAPAIDSKQATLDSPLFTGYILISVYTYTPGLGIRPYQGANITIRGLFYRYSGETDETGDCLFKVHTNLFRTKKYFVRVSIPPGDWLHTKRISFYLEPRQIVYKEFLFVVL
jgi:hypothetical protein